MRGYFSASQKIKCEEVINVLKTELEVVTVGTPDITALSDDERRVFFETIMARVLELAKERNEYIQGIVIKVIKDVV